MTTRASTGALPRSATTNRRTLAYRAGKSCAATRSCQMATALRPRASASTMISRYGSHALALGARPGCTGAAGSVDTSALVAGFGRPESVDTSALVAVVGGPESVDTCPEIAGFGFDSLGRPRPRTAMPAALR